MKAERDFMADTMMIASGRCPNDGELLAPVDLERCHECPKCGFFYSGDLIQDGAPN
jgi:hypothetical protein